MAQYNKICKICGELGHSKFYCKQKRNKPITKRGKRTLEYEQWRDEVARPYLDNTYGFRCAISGCPNKNLDVDHIQKRSTHPHLKMELTNVQYLCRSHHREKEA